jgi:hypothetical protein
MENDMDTITECREILKMYHKEIEMYSLWHQGKSYSQLPQNLQRAIRALTREVMEDEIKLRTI